MPLKAVVTTTPGESDLGNNISIAGISEPDLQVVTIGQLRLVIEQINTGQAAFNNKLKDISAVKIKLLEVKQFNGIWGKLKGYFIQISLKLRYKGHKIVMPLDIVIYAGIYLTGRALEWVEPYLIEY